MARSYSLSDMQAVMEETRRRSIIKSALIAAGSVGLASSPMLNGIHPGLLFALGALPAAAFAGTARTVSRDFWLEKERKAESERRGGKKILGMPPQRDAFHNVLSQCQSKGKHMIDKYMVGYELDSGNPLWIDEEDLCSHACVFAKTGVGKTLWLESLIFQQMARGRASGCTFIDAKRDSGTLAQIILMALITGRIEDLVVVDPFDCVHSYNFVLTNQRADVKARKVLRAGLPPTSDQSATKHYDRLAADSIYRMVRALESFGLAWSINDIAVALSAFNLSYPHLRNLLNKIGARQAMVELGHLASSYRNPKGILDTSRITDNLRGISSELHAISGSEMGGIFCTQYTDLVLTDAILRGKIIYFMLPRLEEAESAARMVKLFREDLEVSIGEITSSRLHHLEDPHLVIVDEGSSTFGPTWANLFELARKGRFALLFGAQSTGGLTDNAIGLSEAFYERVMANVNLKVMMRVGDNRTASDMAEWFGKVSTVKKSYGAGVTIGKSNKAFKGALDLNTMSSGGESHSVSVSEDEEDLVSPEELKHEMSAEKGLAWFDLGDGRIVKGRGFWFDADLPATWEGREFLPRFERFELDEIGLAGWVDEQILSQEKQETSERFAPASKPKAGPPPAKGARPAPGHSDASQKQTQPEEEQKGAFKINLVPKGGKPRGVVSSFSAAPSPAEEKETPKKEDSKKAPVQKEKRFEAGKNESTPQKKAGAKDTAEHGNKAKKDERTGKGELPAAKASRKPKTRPVNAGNLSKSNDDKKTSGKPAPNRKKKGGLNFK